MWIKLKEIDSKISQVTRIACKMESVWHLLLQSQAYISAVVAQITILCEYLREQKGLLHAEEMQQLCEGRQ